MSKAVDFAVLGAMEGFMLKVSEKLVSPYLLRSIKN